MTSTERATRILDRHRPDLIDLPGVLTRAVRDHVDGLPCIRIVTRPDAPIDAYRALIPTVGWLPVAWEVSP